ncbi:hypothetical protein K7X08_025759 [Anisodus acutangulus]|uniref:Uncharacterized protein n=1 Tax=Anisodus acutangulus TaxID=402998 RepID=A0A9Q1QXZ4_9SOLA|nr:hypothetical protein K7X08_025759 [Anisodus acutangulus]
MGFEINIPQIKIENHFAVRTQKERGPNSNISSKRKTKIDLITILSWPMIHPSTNSTRYLPPSTSNKYQDKLEVYQDVIRKCYPCITVQVVMVLHLRSINFCEAKYSG